MCKQRNGTKPKYRVNGISHKQKPRKWRRECMLSIFNIYIIESFMMTNQLGRSLCRSSTLHIPKMKEYIVWIFLSSFFMSSYCKQQELPIICLNQGACYQGTWIESLNNSSFASFQGIFSLK